MGQAAQGSGRIAILKVLKRCEGVALNGRLGAGFMVGLDGTGLLQRK